MNKLNYYCFKKLWSRNEKATVKTVASVEAIGDKDGQRLSTTMTLSLIESKKSNTLIMSSREILRLYEYLIKKKCNGLYYHNKQLGEVA